MEAISDDQDGGGQVENIYFLLTVFETKDEYSNTNVELNFDSNRLEFLLNVSGYDHITGYERFMKHECVREINKERSFYSYLEYRCAF